MSFAALTLKLNDRFSGIAHLIPDVPHHRTDLTNEEEVAVSAYCVFAVAACEEYIEKTCELIAINAHDNFIRSAIVSKVLLGILSSRKYKGDDLDYFNQLFCERKLRILENKHISPVEMRALSSAVEAATTSYVTACKNNNGINKRQLDVIIAPLLFPRSKIPAALMSSISKINGVRGEAAHKTAVSASNLIHPVDLKVVANSLLKEVKRFQKLLIAHSR